MSLEEIHGRTCIMHCDIASNGALVITEKTIDGLLEIKDIVDHLKEWKPSHEQQEPMWCTVDDEPIRMVYHLAPETWYFPSYEQMQEGKVPWELVTTDPARDFMRPVLIPQGYFTGRFDPIQLPQPIDEIDLRIKTIFVDDLNKDHSNMPNGANLYLNVWTDVDDPLCWKTPIRIDPGTKKYPW